MGSTPTEENLTVFMKITNTHPPIAQQFHFWGFILQMDIQSCALMSHNSFYKCLAIHLASLL